MKRVLFLTALCAVLSACATPGSPTASTAASPLVEAVRIDPPSAPAPGPEPVAVVVIEPERPAPATRGSRRQPSQPTPQETLAAANRAARQTPLSASFEDATLIYAYEPGALYELHTNPTFISTILLEPGETLIDIAAGDTARWMVSNTASGIGETGRTLVMVRPQATGLRTNIVLVTDRRAYLLEAVSAHGDGYVAQVAWRYPAPPPPPIVEEPEPAPRAINDAYRIRTPRAGAPPWTPERVFDDGFRTWIEFPADIAASDMPPLFVRTAEGAELVNYRVQGHRYVVDRVFDAAELRLGLAEPIVVRIERRTPARTPRVAT